MPNVDRSWPFGESNLEVPLDAGSTRTITNFVLGTSRRSRIGRSLSCRPGFKKLGKPKRVEVLHVLPLQLSGRALRTVLKFAGPWARSVTEQLAADYLRHLATGGHGVFVGSRHLTQELGAWGVPRLIHLPLGVDTTCFHTVTEERKRELRRKLNLPEDVRVVLYVGRFSPDKDTTLLLRCWQRMQEMAEKKWVGVMVGDGQMKPMVETFTRTHDCLRMVPFLKESKELAEWYQAADLLIHPGRWETFGLVLLEAQACGLPVVAFRGGAMEEQAYDVSQWAKERSSDSLAEAVCRRMERETGAEKDQLRTFIERKFSWQQTFARQMAEYEA